MNREEAKNKLDIFTAFANGEQIQYQSLGNAWGNISSLNDFFEDDINLYRIKPKPEVIWVNEQNNGKQYIYDTEKYAKAGTEEYEYNYKYIAKRFIEEPEED